MKESPVRASVREMFARFAAVAAQATGSAPAFAMAIGVIVVWAALGPVFDYSDTWQLVVNTATTIVTFLMVFLIQHAQNKDVRALHLKLNELIASQRGASNRLIDVEDLSDEELERLTARYRELVERAARLSAGAECSVEGSPAEDEKSSRSA